jgi:hypothetical protein
MKLCSLSTGYLDRSLGPEETRAFEKHLMNCQACRDQTSVWLNFEGALKSMEADRLKLPRVTRRDADDLVRAAKKTHAQSELLRPLLVVSAPLAAVACLFAVLLWTVDYDSFTSPGDTKPNPLKVRILSPDHSGGPVVRGWRQPITAPDRSHLVAEINSDRVGLSPGGEMRILEAERHSVRIRLERGTVACSVSPRRGTGRFEVLAGEYTVRVVGTRFQVTTRPSRPLGVAVEKGTVEVLNRSGVSWILRTGDRIAAGTNGEVAPGRAEPPVLAALNRLLRVTPKKAPPKPVRSEAVKPSSSLSPPPAQELPFAAATPAPSPLPKPKPPQRIQTAAKARAVKPWTPKPAAPKAPKPASSSKTEWRQWILDGRTSDARAAMQEHLRSKPDDSDTWALLADCERKQRNWYTAVKAYEKVIAHGNRKQASHAKYMSATIYQDRLNDHERALALFKEYNRSGFVRSELKDLTNIKIARSLIALSKCGEATNLLQSVVERQGSSFVAANAKKLMKKCEGER